jgi:hypothetical protein
MNASRGLILGLLVVMSVGVSCSHKNGTGAATGNGSPEQTGSVCKVAADCYPGVADGGLVGEAMCLTRVRDGYCTHTCTRDSDCCAAAGECHTGFPQVCSPFESTGMDMCFLSCEPADVADAGAADDQGFCQRFAGPDFICRSSGGGHMNRKVCVPGTCGVGADCTTNADCSGLECITGFQGGYCGRKDCARNADCPADSSCVSAADGHNYCYKNCATTSDCSFCRHDGSYASCESNVTFADADAGMSGSVCVPSL